MSTLPFRAGTGAAAGCATSPTSGTTHRSAPLPEHPDEDLDMADDPLAAATGSAQRQQQTPLPPAQHFNWPEEVEDRDQCQARAHTRQEQARTARQERRQRERAAKQAARERQQGRFPLSLPALGADNPAIGRSTAPLLPPNLGQGLDPAPGPPTAVGKRGLGSRSLKSAGLGLKLREVLGAERWKKPSGTKTVVAQAAENARLTSITAITRLSRKGFLVQTASPQACLQLEGVSMALFGQQCRFRWYHVEGTKAYHIKNVGVFSVDHVARGLWAMLRRNRLRFSLQQGMVEGIATGHYLA
ncbi:hypothetical protein KEM55_003058, partial [Ascosphaera atra]